jgi:hypothetical protein
MQPFDKGKFDKRYADIFAPAISACGLDPYRVDQDPGVTIPIEDIENGIRNARICLAEITLDNPNVWFELGYALSCGKDVILVSEQRTSPYPFDVRHRNIITYSTDSASSYNELEEKIKARLTAVLKKQPIMDSLKSSVVNTDGLSPYEVTALITVMINSVGSTGISVYNLKKEMQKNGYTDAAIAVAITKLLRKNYIQQEMDQDYNGNEFFVYNITQSGEDWVLENEERLLLTQEAEPKEKPRIVLSNGQVLDISDDDLPF